MKDTVSRECLRHDEFKNKVKLGRVRDHFIFSVESLGQWDSDELFLEAVKVLKVKCEGLKKNLANMTR
jgi:DNA-directed RNA polymerase I and III subunit RPAC1